MRRIRYWIRNFFGFSSTETNGLLLLLPVMVALILSQPLYQKFIFSQPPNRYEQRRNDLLDSLVAHWNFNPPPKEDKRVVTTAPFNFNPNTVSKRELQHLGLSPYLAQRIINYRKKGGFFKNSIDLLKIYGMDSSWYRRISPFIVIPVYRTHKKEQQKLISPPINAVEKTFDLNSIDSVQLQSFSGIGPVLASRIVRYRNILGGFLTTDQIKEVYGLTPDVVATVAKHVFIVAGFTPKKISINASAKKLSRHPYITYKLAKLINVYRFQHGNFKTVDDMLQIDIIDSTLLHRVRPYLKVDL